MNLVEETFDRDGYVVIDDFLYEDVVDELHDLAVNHEGIDDQYSDYHSIFRFFVFFFSSK